MLLCAAGSLHGQRSGRAAFQARPVPRNAPLRLALNDTVRVAQCGRKKRFRFTGSGQYLWVHHARRIRGERALPGWRTGAGATRRGFDEAGCAHPAVMLAIPAATRRQMCVHVCPQCEQRRQQRKPEHGQQQDGKKSTQPYDWNTKPRPEQGAHGLASVQRGCFAS